jgi:hypothetical protein
MMDSGDVKRLRERLKELGVAAVKRLEFPTGMHLEIAKWLSEQEASMAKRRRKRSSSSPPRRRRWQFDRVFREMTEMAKKDEGAALGDLSEENMKVRFKADRNVCREARREVLRRFRKRRSQS